LKKWKRIFQKIKTKIQKMCVPFALGANATASTQIFHPPEVGLKLSVGGALFLAVSMFLL
jgi:hypothetical protein